MPNELEVANKRIDSLEKLVTDLQKQLDIFEKRIRRFLKVYPQIIMPEAGAVDVRRDAPLDVQVNSNARINNTHEVVIVAEGAEDVVLIGPFPVGFVGGANPGRAQFPPAAMSMLAALSEYLILCRRVGGSASSFVPTSSPFRTKA